MEKIKNYNCDGLCVQLFCSKRYTHHTKLAINNMFLELGFCEEHSEQYENNLLKIKSGIKND